MERNWRVRQFDAHGVCLGTVFILFMMNIVSSQTDVDVDGLCSKSVSTTVTYTTTDQISRSHRTTTKCGLLGWSRCTAFRTVYSAEPRTASRETHNIVFFCCEGWEPQSHGSCSRITTERASTEPASTSDGTLESNITTPTSFPVDMLSSESSSSVSPSSRSATTSGSPPVEIALPEDVSSNSNPSFLEDKRMLGGIGGVAAALIITVTMMLLLITRRRRRSREKRNTEPGVMFELLTSNSPAQGPTPDIYTEIPVPQNSISSTGQETVTDQGESDYDIAFVHSQRPSSRVNTYQDVKDLVASCNGINEQKKTAVGKEGASAKLMESTAANKIESSVCLGQNGLVYTELDQKGIDKADQAPYQNLTGLDTVIKAPVAFGNGRPSPAASYNKLDRTTPNRVVPTDPDDEAYNTVIIGPTGSEHAHYDKLDRQKSAPHHGSEDQLGVSIPVQAGYSALGVSGSNLAYDKLERHEAQGFDPDRQVGKTRPNTYDEIGATSHTKTYDKLQRQHSADRGLNDSPSKAKPSEELPKSDNEYDIVEIGSPVGQPNPAGGEIYENLPKKPKGKGPIVQNPSPDLNTKTDSTPVVRPLYDMIPGSPRMLNAPVYDLVPTSPRENGIAPLYDIPPALSQQITRKESFEGPASPVNQGGTRPVYDTPPLRLDNTSPLQFEETCPVYENTPTSRKQSIY